MKSRLNVLAQQAVNKYLTEDNPDPKKSNLMIKIFTFLSGQVAQDRGIALAYQQKIESINDQNESDYLQQIWDDINGNTLDLRLRLHLIEALCRFKQIDLSPALKAYQYEMTQLAFQAPLHMNAGNLANHIKLSHLKVAYKSTLDENKLAKNITQ